MKEWVVTYIDPATGKDLPLGECRLHEPTCRYLRPTPARPHTGRRKATTQELRTQARCKVC
jgi:hypothetical protein